jgi:hypothetical protein
MISYVSVEERIPASHPVRRILKVGVLAIERLKSTGVKSQRLGEDSPAGSP